MVHDRSVGRDQTTSPGNYRPTTYAASQHYFAGPRVHDIQAADIPHWPRTYGTGVHRFTRPSGLDLAGSGTWPGLYPTYLPTPPPPVVLTPYAKVGLPWFPRTYHTVHSVLLPATYGFLPLLRLSGRTFRQNSPPDSPFVPNAPRHFVLLGCGRRRTSPTTGYPRTSRRGGSGADSNRRRYRFNSVHFRGG